MNQFQTSWTHNELKAYMLLYAAHADFEITSEEKKYIKSRVEIDKFKHIKNEFDQDNDYQRIQKIQSTIERFEYSQDEISKLFQSMKNLFLADGEMDIKEKNIMRGFRRLLKSNESF